MLLFLARRNGKKTFTGDRRVPIPTEPTFPTDEEEMKAVPSAWMIV